MRESPALCGGGAEGTHEKGESIFHGNRGVGLARIPPMFIQPPTQVAHMANDNDVGHECPTYDTAGETPPRVPPLTPPQPSPTGGGGRTAELQAFVPASTPETPPIYIHLSAQGVCKSPTTRRNP